MATMPLMFAAATGKVKMVQALLVAGVKPRETDASSRTKADYARGKRGARIREILEYSS